ncbi:hypothetical protein TVAG_427020 [Trichomonas vaginalis G3]|uniref:Uncharacterized protein n=1 Tax=Trichomonas vaginalis (strain ATCC PRA-98 / G3) TaxID=412133 RepID=A2FNN5_TRIV3|nr:inner centromere protein, ARK binding region-containing protein [Trichomonas vaginalis G3]EAX93474.1 hypothetical protein TVAG_427020 [Trichomonas vaginalis G3]KAI5535785.1 inner centromere protein, ARK binding region-containing protein [Trichomonas vaginalis G3]|eukprot:XP_001306404.1 hypothetical protein [Trichomonas vaginalis G3]
MLSFTNICKELEDDLQLQEAKLEIFSKNNFIWLEKINKKLDPNSNLANNTVDISNVPNNQKELALTNENHNNSEENTQNISNNQAPRRSSLRTNVPIRPHDFDSDSSIDFPASDDANHHVTIQVLQNNDALSSNTDAQASPITLARAEENYVSKVTPQRNSLVKQIIENESPISESSASSCFDVDSDVPKTPVKKDSSVNLPTSPKISYADTRDLRTSIDPTNILLSSEEFTSSVNGVYSISKDASQLSQQAKLMRQKWAKIVAEKNQLQQANGNQAINRVAMFE